MYLFELVFGTGEGGSGSPWPPGKASELLSTFSGEAEGARERPMWTNKPCSVSPMQKKACLSFKFKKQHTSGKAAILSKLKLDCICLPQSYKQD